MKGLLVVLATGTRIAPFGDPPGEAFFSGETVAETQTRAAAHLGLEVVFAASPREAEAALAAPRRGPKLLLADRVYVSQKAAKDFLRASAKAARPAALALEINASVEWALPLQPVERRGDLVVHDVLRVDGAALPPAGDDALAWLGEIRRAAAAVDVPKREIVAEVPLPTIGERAREVLRYPVTSTVVVTLDHWVHVLWLNQIAFGIRWMELLRRRPLWGLFRAATAFPWSRHHLLDRLVWRGRGADVHPTAYVSGSILGAGVTVGAGVTLRNAIVGDGAVIQDHAVLLNSVVGPRSLVMGNTFLVSSVLYPEATVGNYKLQVSLIGRGAYVNPWAAFVDAKFVGHVKVQKDGALVSSERAFLGSCIGHRAKMAAKVMIQAGRDVPNDTVVVMRPDEVVRVVPASLPPGVPHVRDRGTLVPLGEEGQGP